MVGIIKCGPQDMPPKGGYSPLPFERIPLRRFFGVKRTLSMLVLVSSLGLTGYYYSYKRKYRNYFENLSARNALLPMLIAERDRAYLKQVKKNRDVEKELMKDVPDWEVGTYYGEPIYITTAGKYRNETYEEFFGQSQYADLVYRFYRTYVVGIL